MPKKIFSAHTGGKSDKVITPADHLSIRSSCFIITENDALYRELEFITATLGIEPKRVPQIAIWNCWKTRVPLVIDDDALIGIADKNRIFDLNRSALWIISHQEESRYLDYLQHGGQPLNHWILPQHADLLLENISQYVDSFPVYSLPKDVAQSLASATTVKSAGSLTGVTSHYEHSVTETSLLDRVRRKLSSSTDPIDTNVLAQLLRKESDIQGNYQIFSAVKRLHGNLLGLGPLEKYLSIPHLTDILLVGHREIYVDSGAGLLRQDPVFTEETQVRDFAYRLAYQCGRRLDDSHPWVDGQFTATGGIMIRLHAIISPITRSGTCISLRILRPQFFGFDQLIEHEMIDSKAELILRDIVSQRVNFFITGGTGTGKTTMLSALLGLVDRQERIIIIEDAPELSVAGLSMVQLVSRESNIEGSGGIGMEVLVRQALRMRPDRLVVGEVRGKEIFELFKAFNSGHQGGGATIHANSVHDIPARVNALMGYAESADQLLAGIGTVISIARDQGGIRRVVEIAIPKKQRGTIVMDSLYRHSLLEQAPWWNRYKHNENTDGDSNNV